MVELYETRPTVQQSFWRLVSFAAQNAFVTFLLFFHVTPFDDFYRAYVVGTSRDRDWVSRGSVGILEKLTLLICRQGNWKFQFCFLISITKMWFLRLSWGKIFTWFSGWYHMVCKLVLRSMLIYDLPSWNNRSGCERSRWPYPSTQLVLGYRLSPLVSKDSIVKFYYNSSRNIINCNHLRNVSNRFLSLGLINILRLAAVFVSKISACFVRRFTIRPCITATKVSFQSISQSSFPNFLRSSRHGPFIK